jgi:hypothetical protein
VLRIESVKKIQAKEAFALFREKMSLIQSNRSILKKQFIRALHRTLNPYFRRWKKKVQSFKIIAKSFVIVLFVSVIFSKKEKLKTKRI